MTLCKILKVKDIVKIFYRLLSLKIKKNISKKNKDIYSKNNTKNNIKNNTKNSTRNCTKNNTRSNTKNSIKNIDEN